MSSFGDLDSGRWVMLDDFCWELPGGMELATDRVGPHSWSLAQGDSDEPVCAEDFDAAARIIRWYEAHGGVENMTWPATTDISVSRAFDLDGAIREAARVEMERQHERLKAAFVRLVTELVAGGMTLREAMENVSVRAYTDGRESEVVRTAPFFDDEVAAGTVVLSDAMPTNEIRFAGTWTWPDGSPLVQQFATKTVTGEPLGGRCKCGAKGSIEFCARCSARAFLERR